MFDSVTDLRGTHQQMMNTNAAVELMDMKPAYPLFQVQPVNWKPLVYTAILLSVKFLEDNLFWNADVVAKLKLFDLQATNRYEHLFLSVIDFELAPAPQQFDDYFKWLLIYKQFVDKQKNQTYAQEQEMTVDE